MGPHDKQSGAAIGARPADELDAWEVWAPARYDEIRADSTDIGKIAQTVDGIAEGSGGHVFIAGDIADIKQHVFFSEHPLTDDDTGGLRSARYDP